MEENPDDDNHSHFNTPLHLAISKGQKEMVEHLGGQGVDLNHPTFQGDTPLHLAIHAGNKEMVECLLKGGADSNLPIEYGQTAINLAIWRDEKEIVKLLIEGGADLNNEDMRMIMDKYWYEEIAEPIRNAMKKVVGCCWSRKRKLTHQWRMAVIKRSYTSNLK